jgi:sugar phosphate isomerase/epimerase
MWRTPDPDRFVVGVNLPWIGYGTDVGASRWFPDGGFARQPAALETLDRTLAALARDGIGVARVFLLCDARSGVEFEADGAPRGIDAAVLADIDAMLAAARRHSIGLIPVLLDFHLCGPRRRVNDVQLGGRSRLIADPESGAAFIDRVLRPIVERYANDEAVVAWDVMNEPEWCAVPFDAMQRFLGEAVQCVRRFARQPVTIGSAGTWALDLVRPLGLDFYQVHWYDRFGWPALVRPVAELGLPDRPVILGEFAGRSPRIGKVLEAAKQAGYEGALVWSVLADDEQSAYPPELVEWVRGASA